MRRIEMIVVHHTASSPDVTLEQLRRVHTALGFSDVGYHYLVFDDGRVLAGRDVSRVGAHTRGHNAYSIGVAAVGNYESGRPSDKLLAALEELLLHLVDRYRIDARRVYAHRELAKTVCPGRHLYDWLVGFRSSSPVKK